MVEEVVQLEKDRTVEQSDETKLKGTVNIASGQSIEVTGEYPSGSTSDGTVALTDADTWYAVPTTAPTEDYILVVSSENAAGTIRWSYDNGGTPSATNGNKLPIHLALKLGANKTIYAGSSDAGDDVNYTIIEKE